MWDPLGCDTSSFYTSKGQRLGPKYKFNRQVARQAKSGLHSNLTHAQLIRCSPLPLSMGHKIRIALANTQLSNYFKATVFFKLLSYVHILNLDIENISQVLKLGVHIQIDLFIVLSKIAEKFDERFGYNHSKWYISSILLQYFGVTFLESKFTAILLVLTLHMYAQWTGYQ